MHGAWYTTRALLGVAWVFRGFWWLFGRWFFPQVFIVISEGFGGVSLIYRVFLWVFRFVFVVRRRFSWC